VSSAEQIAAFRDATHVISPHGAGLANMLWCAPRRAGPRVFHPHYGTWAYAMLNDVLDVEYATLVARDTHARPATPTMSRPAAHMWVARQRSWRRVALHQRRVFDVQHSFSIA